MEIGKEFEYIKLKEEHFLKACKMLIECNWAHKIVLFEDTSDYYTMVSVTFRDEAKYFRHIHIPLPRLQKIVEEEGEYSKIAEQILKKIENGEAITVPRTIWGKMHIKDIVEVSKS